jgi:hypothetical protein
MRGLLRRGGADYEALDPAAVQALGDAVNADDFGPYLAAYPPNKVSHGY